MMRCDSCLQHMCAFCLRASLFISTTLIYARPVTVGSGVNRFSLGSYPR
jgi:hypothetical protein